MIKLKKTLLIISIVLVLSIISIFTYLFIDSKLYKLECSRINDGELESYDFEFNIFNKITNMSYKEAIYFSNREDAIDYCEEYGISWYEENFSNNALTIYYETDGEVGKNINDIKNEYQLFGYSCKEVEK